WSAVVDLVRSRSRFRISSMRPFRANLIVTRTGSNMSSESGHNTHAALAGLGSGLPASVDIYDTTLRDGSQQEGMSLSVDDKLRVARQLDHLGVQFIEGGWPGANPKDA